MATGTPGTIGVVRHWNREAIDAPSLEVLRWGWMMLWATWSGESLTALNLNHSVSCVPMISQRFPKCIVSLLCWFCVLLPSLSPSDHFCPCCLLHLVHNSSPDFPSLEDKCMQKRCRCHHALGEEMCYRQLEKWGSSLCQRGCLTLEFTAFLDAFWSSAEFFA